MASRVEPGAAGLAHGATEVVVEVGQPSAFPSGNREAPTWPRSSPLPGGRSVVWVATELACGGLSVGLSPWLLLGGGIVLQ